MLNRAYSLIDVKSVSEDQRIIQGVATSPAPDRMGDVVEPLGVKYKNPLPLLHHHNSAEPVGTVRFSKPTKNGIEFTAKFAEVDGPPSLKERIDVAFAEVKAGLVRGVSIGFRSLEKEPLDAKDPFGGIRFTETEVLELSLVTIPANADATIQVIKKFDTDSRAATGRNGTGGETNPAGDTAKPTTVVKAQEAKRIMPKTIAESIASFEATLVAKNTALSEIVNKSIEDGETLTADQKDAVASLKVEIQECEEHIALLKEHDERSRKTAIEVRGATPEEASRSRYSIPAQPIRARQPVEKWVPFVRFVQALVNARGNLMQAERMAASMERWKAETPEVIDAVRAAATMGTSNFDPEFVTRTAVAAGTTTDSTFAGPLVNYQILASDFIEYLRPRTIIGRIPGLRRVPFKVKVPRMTGGSTTGWVGERSVKPVSSIALDTVTLEHYKIAGIVVISEELARFSNPSAEAIIRDDLSKSIIQYMDAQFTDPTVAAVTGVNPASITNGVTPVTASGTTAAALRTDLANVLDNFTAANIDLSGVVGIMTQTQALKISLMSTTLAAPQFPGMNRDGGSLAGIPIVATENLAATGGSPTDGYPIIFVRADEILLADDGQVTVDASREASLQMDTAPTSPPTGDTVPFSLWQHNCVGLRAERFVAWAKARTESVQFIQNAKYAE